MYKKILEPTETLNKSLRPCHCKESRLHNDIIVEDKYICGKCRTSLGKLRCVDSTDRIKKYRPYNVTHHVSCTLRRMQCIENNQPSKNK